MRTYVLVSIAGLSAILALGCARGAGSGDPADSGSDGIVQDRVVGRQDSSDASGAEDSQSDAVPLPEAGFCEPNLAEFPVRPGLEIPPTLPFLHVNGTSIVDETGNSVALRGFNFGSWLAMETWVVGLGTMDEDTLLEQLDGKAAELGLGDLLKQARTTNLLDWLFESKTHWTLIQEWSQYCFDHAAPEQQGAVEQLWAWFDEQPWILEEESLWRWLDGRFGPSKSEDLRRTFHDHYITEVDVQRLADNGLNLIRVPIWYRHLETDYVGENGFVEEGWDRLHLLALWARKHRVYLMLDLHGAPGGQSTSAHQGLANGGQLWDHPECIDKTARLWQALASYFADDPHVAIYDLLNEPMNCPDKESYVEVHQAIYEAIRAEDDQHIVAVEDGWLGDDKLASPLEMGWKNAMWSYHFYPWGAASAKAYVKGAKDDLARLNKLLPRYQCPVLAGEFTAAAGKKSGPWAVEAMDEVLALLNQHGVHWTIWSWKFFADWAIWGLYHPAQDSGVRIDVKEASFDEIKARFEGQDSTGFEPHEAFQEVIWNRSADPVSEQDLSVDSR